MYRENFDKQLPLLAVDIGNTSIALGLFLNPSDARLLKTAKIASHPALPASKIAEKLHRFLGRRIARKGVYVVIGSVVPPLAKTLAVATRSVSRVTLAVNARCDLGFRLAVDTPATLGADRIANAAAAWTLRKRPVAVADFGSATTISIMDGDAFRGGTILPGVTMMRDALSCRTARLPLAFMEANVSAVGTNTDAAIRSGIVLGTAGAVEKIVSTAERELRLKLSLFITGGNASSVIPFLSRSHRFVPDLTLQGFRLIFIRRLDLST
ncbi:MAG TPA: type III pantothenate kinase [Dissulfurispiraceae bacterium]|nr:type III pantothenate kinase [Dissulfurispiraceae bacterium]